jgi:branched-chain amino acid transport system substrate-binding protein
MLLRRRSRTSDTARVTIAVLAAALTLTACGGSSGGAHSALNVDAFTPLSGAEAVFGPESTSGCYTAIEVINAAGGVLGHQMHCIATDSRSDAADAVPAAQQVLATVSNLVGIVGPSTNEAPSTVSIFEKAHIPMIAQTGDPQYDHAHIQYFYRPTPADDINGLAMDVWAYTERGYRRAAAVFGNDVAGQGVVPNLVRGFEKLGGTIVSDQRLVLDQTSYRTEVAKVMATRPQVIFTELDPQTAATFFAELKEANGLVPVVGDGGTIGYPAWVTAVKGAIGAEAMGKFYTGVQILNPRNGIGYDAYTKAVMKIPIKDPSQFLHDPYTTSNYDSVVALALAMTAAKSTDPSVFNSEFLKIVNGTPGAVNVYTYAEGLGALKAGKTIRFVGSAGAMHYDQYHNNSLPWEVDSVTSNGSLVLRGIVPAGDVTALGT